MQKMKSFSTALGIRKAWNYEGIGLRHPLSLPYTDLVRFVLLRSLYNYCTAHVPSLLHKRTWWRKVCKRDDAIRVWAVQTRLSVAPHFLEGFPMEARSGRRASTQALGDSIIFCQAMDSSPLASIHSTWLPFTQPVGQDKRRECEIFHLCHEQDHSLSKTGCILTYNLVHVAAFLL